MSKTFGQRLAELLAKKQWSKYQLARESGVSAAYLGRLEAEKQEPSFAVACKIADALKVRVDDLRPR